jgi:hypothetical protein
MTTKIDIDAVESRIDELRSEYIAARQVHSDAIGALPADATLRYMDARRSKAAELTREALAEQGRIAAELVEAAGDALDWARGNHDRALGAAHVLESSGDARMMHVLSAQHDDTRAALAYLDEWRDDPSRVLDDIALKMSAVRMPDDSRIGPNADVARRIADEDAEQRAAEVAAMLEARQAMQAEMSRVPGAPTRLVSDESRERRASRRRRAPYGHGG